MFKRVIPSKAEPFISFLIGLLFFGIVFLAVAVLSDKDSSPKNATTETVQEDKNKVEQKKENGLNIITYKAANVQAVDGDTLKVKNNNNKEISIRLLYVDTPESVHPNKTEQSYGKKAGEYTQSIIEQADIVDFIVTGTDKYDRVLALVKVDGESLQQKLLTNGFARIGYVSIDQPSDTDETNAYKKEQLSLFNKYEQQAQSNKLRIWSNKNYVTKDGFNDLITLDEIPNP